ncbi:MAG: NFACT RNA binding domain-containing protein [Cyanobacteria bacterium P01_A01_bin.105]
MQPVDFTTLMAVCSELRSHYLPARCEQVVQRDRYTLCMALRTLQGRHWLTLSWHPQAARLHIGAAPPKAPDTFTFSQQLKHQLNGLALTQLNVLAPWERALDLQFAARPGEAPQHHLYLEIMGKYSNLLLTHADQTIITAAHQVSESQSSLRPIRTGDRYAHPPALSGPLPKLEEPYDAWQDRISLIPGKLRKMMIQSYSGLSSALVRQLCAAANLDAETATDTLSKADWQRLFEQWQTWLTRLQTEDFEPGWLAQGYTVLRWGQQQPADSTQQLLQTYYQQQLDQQTFSRLHHQLSQKLKTVLGKLGQKARDFQQRLALSDQADTYRQQADLLMAYPHAWQPGLTQLELTDFETGDPVKIPLVPDKTGIQNAQRLYKKHQKQKRAREAILPLLATVNEELKYLEQVEAALQQLPTYTQPSDLEALEEIRNEVIDQGYLNIPYVQAKKSKAPNFRQFTSPDGHELLVGRNNNQNDTLTSKIATDYDLWLHTQEIPGSHVLLRLDAGEVASDADLAFAADIAAYFSRARQSEQVPVVYTQPKHVYKPKGARPGMVIYTHERVLWGQPQRVSVGLEETAEG